MTSKPLPSLLILASALLAATAAPAAPTVTRLTPPSELFASGQPEPVIARFLPGQRFDLQATVKPDAGQRITAARFFIDGKPVTGNVALRDCASGCVKGLAAETAIATVRAVSLDKPGRHELRIEATQADGQTATARGNFDVVPFAAAMGPKVKNVIILLGDGMGAAQRTAARIVKGGYAQGKVVTPLAMDSFPATALVKTASLNSVVTDSSPGMTSYVSGNKNNNNEEGVFPDDTLDAFDNPRIEYLSEYLHRTEGKALGIVTTADVFDATPAGNAVHTSNRGAGTGIVDQFFDDRERTGLTVLLGGGRKWFLPAGTPGSERAESNDYAFSSTDAHTADIVRRWGVAPGAKDKDRDLIKDFQSAGYRYAPTRTELMAADGADKLLGLFSFSNMNVALDKIDGRRGAKKGLSGTVVDDYGFPDQPMLDEMARAALNTLKKQPKGFVLMIEGASIDKQAHNMDTERWMLDTIEFDRAVQVAQDFARENGDTLVIVTADHECSGAALIGGSMLTDKALQEAIQKKGAAHLRDKVVGVYEKAGFPRYRLAADGYPEATDIDYRLLVGYGANADRYEDWRTNNTPLRDSQQPMAKTEPLKWYPPAPLERDDALGDFLVTGQVPGESAVHTATDIPLSAFGPGALAFTGVIDNTDVFFKLAQAAVKGTTAPADTTGARRPAKARR
ncbi:alkaline phosphatase [Roseateles terrae]|uniref:Alkaline phosphatase n=1 Tax=Roseateles terrae TaxID=431060 RepID=A0ABR6GYS1_9BURK|nr:alkaline phosphatase [Roseateles terrae]MBB3197253.1 alkaline phosphatase [Roseateles terrae]OWQ83684.1 alkaline phosphatase [Roseateles terrae]